MSSNVALSVLLEGELLHKTRLTKRVQHKNYRLTSSGALQRERRELTASRGGPMVPCIEWLDVVPAQEATQRSYSLIYDTAEGSEAATTESRGGAPTGFVVPAGDTMLTKKKKKKKKKKTTIMACETLIFTDATTAPKRLEWTAALESVWGSPKDQSDDEVQHSSDTARRMLAFLTPPSSPSKTSSTTESLRRAHLQQQIAALKEDACAYSPLTASYVSEEVMRAKEDEMQRLVSELALLPAVVDEAASTRFESTPSS